MLHPVSIAEILSYVGLTIAAFVILSRPMVISVFGLSAVVRFRNQSGI